jgi:pimeloyl-ACP methyl ester carboxylesterase
MLLAAAAAALLYAVAVGALWLRQEKLLFQPEVLDPAYPLATDPDVREAFVERPDARLSMLELRLPEPRGVVFYLHGNGGSLRGWFVNRDFWRRTGYDLVMIDYRGYGKSTGRIEAEAQLHEDVAAAWQVVAPRYQGRRVVLFGRSLGTGLAARLAARIQPDLTILASPYRSLEALAREHYPWVPSAVLRYPLRTDLSIGQITGPVLLLHGERDTLIPPSHSEALLERAPTARLVRIPGAGHADLQEFDRYLAAITDALAALR